MILAHRLAILRYLQVLSLHLMHQGQEPIQRYRRSAADRLLHSAAADRCDRQGRTQASGGTGRKGSALYAGDGKRSHDRCGQRPASLMALYVLGDLHLAFGVDKPMDVFGGRWEGYTEKLREGLSVLTDEDTLVIPGDFCWALGLAMPPFSRLSGSWL